MVRLGSGGLTVGHLAPDAADRALAALERFASLAHAHGCEKIIATATSAVREADNGDKFLKRVRRKTGIDVVLLSGAEEARLIARAVDYVRALGDKPTLGIDIGGGSTEFWILQGGENKLLVSLKLGSVRLNDGFVHSDPIAKRDQERLRGFIIGTMARLARDVNGVGFEQVVVTSGTALTLAQMAYAAEHGTSDPALLPPQDTEGIELTAKELRRIVKQVTRLPLREREIIPGLPPERADIIVAGAILLDTIFDELGIRKAQTCDWSLREGVLINYLESHFGTPVRGGSTAGDDVELNEIRRRSVFALARRCEFDEGHGLQTARLSKAIFDQTTGLHGLDSDARELLEAAAILHDIGYTISHNAHNRHAQYLIMNSELLGFSSRDLSIVGNVVRYHQQSVPRKEHAEYARLRPADRKLVRKLSAILRVADALDRTSRAAVSGLAIDAGTRTVTFGISAATDCQLEVWAARRKCKFFEKVFGAKADFVVAGRQVPEQAAAVS
jgi:exopolyphosphatase/guanosine-5'-triphosphate,3'-diphosphate pyrophosphatase